MSEDTFQTNRYDQKKVQAVKGSYYIYLPKHWCKKYGLDTLKNRVVYMKRLTDETLLISANARTFETQTTYIISMDQNISQNEEVPAELHIEYLFNLMLTAYIIGYHTIILKKKTKIPLRLKNQIHKFARKLYGMVVISETQTQIVIEEHLDEVDLKVLSKQLLTKVGMQLDNFIELLQTFPENESNIDKVEFNEMIHEIIEQDDQVDEHRYALERYVHQILINPTLGRKIQVSSVECLHYSENARMLERVGDHITKLARLLKKQPIIDHKFILNHLRKVVEIYEIIQDYYWRKDSLKLFTLINDIKEYSLQLKTYESEDLPDMEYLIPIRRICNICSDIAEIRINDILSRQQANENGN
ncbi:MAG: PhoU domain-containing protein [Promethearchaeota archaeon]